MSRVFSILAGILLGIALIAFQEKIYAAAIVGLVGAIITWLSQSLGQEASCRATSRR